MSNDELIAIGVVTRPHGINGELRVKVLTDFPDRYSLLERVYLTKGERIEAFPVERVREHQGDQLLQLAGIDTLDEANVWRTAYVKIPKEELVPLPEGSYYVFELIGCTVVTDTGEKIGELVDVLTTAANDVYVVKGKKQEILLPAIRDVVRDIDLSTGTITVRLLPGLVD